MPKKEIKRKFPQVFQITPRFIKTKLSYGSSCNRAAHAPLVVFSHQPYADCISTNIISSFKRITATQRRLPAMKNYIDNEFNNDDWQYRHNNDLLELERSTYQPDKNYKITKLQIEKPAIEAGSIVYHNPKKLCLQQGDL